MKRLLYTLLPLLALLAACEPDTTCRTDENVRLVLTMKGVHVSGTDTVSFTSIDSLTVYGVGSDSVLYNNNKSVSKISLPLRKNADSTQFVMTFNDKTDMLTVRHRNTDYFVSLACGCFVYHTIDTIYAGRSVIDSVGMVEYEIANYENTNAVLYLYLED